MPDFTYETHWQCAESNTMNIGGYVQSHLFVENAYPTCTCPAYVFSKRTKRFGNQTVPKFCKHILSALQSQCGWMGFVDGDEDQIDPDDPHCPRCGGRAEAVQIAV